jgi:hypothetical protein
MNALRELKEIAIREGSNEIVGADVLIATALRALLEGVDSPSLPLLAGLSRREEGEAHDLFRAVTAELDIAPPSPTETPADRWHSVRWLCEAIADGTADSGSAGRLIWRRWRELGEPDSLRPIVNWISQWDEWNPDPERRHLRERIVEEAKRFLEGP